MLSLGMKKEDLISIESIRQIVALWSPGMPIIDLTSIISGMLNQIEIHTKENLVQEVVSHTVLYHLISSPGEYIENLLEHDRLELVFPEIALLKGLQQNSPYHTEDVYTHTLNVLHALAAVTSNECRIAAVFHDTGKAVTQVHNTENDSYHFYGHERISEECFISICKRFNWQRKIDMNLVLWLIRNHMKIKAVPDDDIKGASYIEKHFFAEKDGINPTDIYRECLLHLALADICGAVPLIDQTRHVKLLYHNRIVKLFDEVGLSRVMRMEEDALMRSIKCIWNGRTVMDNFSVNGRAIKHYVINGQKYVRDRMAKGEKNITEQEVVEYIRSSNPKSDA